MNMLEHFVCTCFDPMHYFESD